MNQIKVFKVVLVAEDGNYVLHDAPTLNQAVAYIERVKHQYEDDAQSLAIREVIEQC